MPSPITHWVASGDLLRAAFSAGQYIRLRHVHHGFRLLFRFPLILRYPRTRHEGDHFEGEITFLNILPGNYTAEQKGHSDGVLVEAIRKHGAKALYRIEVVSSDEPLELLVQRSAGLDLLIVGTAKVGLLERAVVGPFSSQIATRSQCSVVVVKVAPPVKKLLKV